MLMAFIILFTIVGMVNGQTVLFNETFSNVSYQVDNFLDDLECDWGDFELDDIWTNNPENITLDNVWKCWSNQAWDVNTSSNYQVKYTENTLGGYYNTLNGLKIFISLSNISSPFKHTTFVHKFDTTQDFELNTTFDFYCRDPDVDTDVADHFIYLVLGNATNERVVINLGHDDSDCDVSMSGFLSDYDLSNNCCILDDVIGSANTCQDVSFKNPSFTAQQIVDSCGVDAGDFQDIDYIMLWSASSIAEGTIWQFDDLTITEVAIPSNITNLTYFEDFEDTNFTEYTLDRWNPKTYIGSTENPIITTNEDVLRHNTINKLNRVSDTPDASAYAVRGNTTYIYGSGYSGVRGGVDIVDVDLQSYNFILNPEFEISFDMKQNLIQWTNDDVVAYLLLRHSTNVSLVALNKKTGQPEWCDLDTLLGKNLTTSWDTYSFTIQDMIDNGCTVSHIINETLTDIEFVSQTGTVIHDDVEYTVYLDNIIVSGSGVPTNYTPPVIPNVTEEIHFEELFGESAFSFDEDECTTQGDTTTQMKIYATAMDFGNYSWRCYMDSKNFNYISFENTSDTSKINTPQGLDIYSSTTLNFPLRHRKLTTIFIGGDNIDIEYNDTISFTCMIPDQSTQIDAFLYFGKDDNATALLSLGKDSPTQSGCNIIGIPDAHCCDLDDIVGEDFDCNSDTKVNVEIGFQEMLNACPEFVDYDFHDMTDIGFWITEYDFAGYSYIYFDDYKFSLRESVVGNNTLPTVASVSPDPNPANVSEVVSWEVSVFDDDQSDDIYTAFDCENDGTLDYGWVLNRTKISSKKWEFNCTYSSEGTYTGVAWVTDVTHDPINSSGSNQVEVALTTTEGEGGGCDGFVAPPCIGDCKFLDDFSYTGYPITCNGWSGITKHPTNQKLVVQNLEFLQDGIEVEFDEIHDYEYNSVLFSFDWIINTDERVIMTLGDPFIYEEAVYLYWDGGSLFSLDYVSPYVTNLGSYTNGVEYSLIGIIDFENKEIDYNVLGSNTTVEFFEERTETIGDIDFYWTSTIGMNITIDNMLVSTGEINTNGTTPVETVDYVYDGDFFCAINWTGDPARFSTDNCEARGYPITGNLVGLCMPRACLSDIGSSLFASAMSNILMTLVVLIAIVLVVPLLIAMRRKR